MSRIRFRKYQLQKWDTRKYGFMYDRSHVQPTLDIYLGKVILVWFRDDRW